MKCGKSLGPLKFLAKIITVLRPGILESPEDFSSSAELYEAVGGMILESGGEEAEEKRVQELCDDLFRVIQG